jgi:hypothetical protein
MQEQLDYLVTLQEIDRAIQEAIVNAEANPKRIEVIVIEIQEAQDAFKLFLQGVDDLKKQRKGLEKEIDELDHKIKKSQLRLMEVKNNKEYKAMLTEIEETKKGKGEKEDQLLELLEKLEEKTQKGKELKKSLEKKMEEAQNRKGELEKEGKDVSRKLSALDRKRGELIPRIDSALLKQYEFLKDRLKGVAVVEVKEYSCLGCHMQIPPQLYNELHRQDRIIACPSCLRILYYKVNPVAEGEA